MSKPTVSVIIPSYNCERYIGETIDSILAQSYKDIEIIVVDDGSTDRTQDIVSSYGAPVRLVTQANSRVCAARNRGIREATGEFICLMDHDDYWFPDKIARQVEVLREHPEVGVVYSSFIEWHSGVDGNFPLPASFDLVRNSCQDDIEPDFSGWIYHQLLLDCWILTSTTMFRSEVFKTCGVFDESLPYSEDWELWFRVSRTYQIMKLRKPTTLYRQHIQQGNRIFRDIDYRTLLLTQVREKWGLCSCDGRCTSIREFLGRIATYHAEYAFSCLQAGRRGMAIPSFAKAWFCNPVEIKYLAYIPASLLGWSPKW